MSQYTAEDAVIPDSPIVNQNLSIREFVNNYVIGKERWKKFLVVDDNQQLMGTIATEDLKQTPTSQWNDVFLQDLVKPVSPADTIPANTSLLEAAKLFETQKPPAFIVVNELGEVLGLLEKASIIDLMTKEEAKSKTVVESAPEDEKAIIN